MSGLPEQLPGTRLARGVPRHARRAQRGAAGRRPRPRGVRRAAAGGHRAALAGGRAAARGGQGHRRGRGRLARADDFGRRPVLLLQRFADSVALAADRARLQAVRARAARLAQLHRGRRGPPGRLARPGHDHGDHRPDRRPPDRARGAPSTSPTSAASPCCSRSGTRTSGRSTRCARRWRRRPGRRAVTGAVSLPGTSATSIPLVARRQADRHAHHRPARGRAAARRVLPGRRVDRPPGGAGDRQRAGPRALQAAGQALQESLLPAVGADGAGLRRRRGLRGGGRGRRRRRRLLRPVPGRDGTWCFVVGDVCGTGAEAAAVTGLARHTIQALVRAGLPRRGDPGAAERRDPRRGPAVPLPDAGLRHAARRRAAGSGSTWSTPATRRRSSSRRTATSRRSGRPRPCSGWSTTSPTSPRATARPRRPPGRVTDGVLERRDGDRMLGEEAFADELASAGTPAGPGGGRPDPPARRGVQRRAAARRHGDPDDPGPARRRPRPPEPVQSRRASRRALRRRCRRITPSPNHTIAPNTATTTV